MHHQTTDGIDLLIAKLGVEVVVELFDGGQTMDGEYALADAADLFLFIVARIIFIFDLTDDELKAAVEYLIEKSK